MSGLGILEHASFEGLLVGGATVVLSGCVLWGVAVLVAAVVEVATSGRLAPVRRLGCPPVLRRRLIRIVAAVLAASSFPWSTAAHASNRPEPRPDSLAALALRLEGLPLPDRVMDGPAAAPAPQAASVEVRTGDTLWAIAIGRLPSTATPAQVQTYLRELYASNRDLIGPDPDLIHPGQRLLLPRTAPPSTKGTR